MPHTILLIDDDPDFITTLQMNLEMNNFTVDASQDPITGWKKFEEIQPEILLIDWEMPGMSGIEFIQRVKQHSEQYRCYSILITGRTQTEDIVQGLDAGADDYLVKPFEMSELLARIRTGFRFRMLEQQITDETKRLTVLEMALSVADKIGNPIAAAKLHQQLLEENSHLQQYADIHASLKTLGVLLDEALLLIQQFQTIKIPRSIPAPGGRTMIAPD